MTVGIDIEELRGLDPAAIIVEPDFEEKLQELIDDLVARFPAIQPVVALESEPSRKLLQVYSYGDLLIRARINDAIRANLLAYAQGTDLDHLAAFYDLTRMVDPETNALETDERFRERTVLAIRGRSTGGTEPRYRLIAMSADLAVADALPYVVGTDPLINVAVYSTDPGGVASPALLATVEAALNDPSVRMVNDQIVVRSAVTQTVDVEAKVWLLPTASASLIDELPTLLKASWDAENGLGFDMTRSWLTARLMVPGVQRVEIVSPSENVVNPDFQSVAMGTVTILDQGRDY